MQLESCGSLWQLAEECERDDEGSAVARLRLCAAAAEVLGEPYPDPARWRYALSGLHLARAERLRAAGWFSGEQDGPGPSLTEREDVFRSIEDALAAEIDVAINRFDANWNRLCEEPADEPEEEGPMATKTKRPPRRTKAERTTPGWRCQVCGENNPPESDACGACDTPRGEPVKPKAARRGKTNADYLQARTTDVVAEIPTTQAEASAKEADADVVLWPELVHGPGGQQYVCARCGRTNSIAVTCECGWKPPPAAVIYDALRRGEQTSRELPAARSEAAPVDRDIDLKAIKWRRDNPRTVFDDAVEKVQASLHEVGQLQPISVRENDAGRFEGWIGECRCRAATALGWKTIRALVYPRGTPDADLVLKRCDENDKRSDLNPIDDARSLQQKLEALGWRNTEVLAGEAVGTPAVGTQHPSLRSLAKRIGLSEGEISNKLGLLKLPDEWQKRVITREITYSQARLLLPWSGRPVVLKEVAHRLKGSPERTTAEFEECVDDAVDFVSRPCTRGTYFQGKIGKEFVYDDVRLTKADLQEHAAELDLIEVDQSNWQGKRSKVQRTFNVALWEKLFTQRRSEHQAKKLFTQRRSEHQAKDREPTAAELKQRREKQAKILREKVWRYKVRWLQQRAAEKVRKAEGYVGIKLLLAFAATDDHQGRRRGALADVVRAAGGSSKGRDYGGIDAWKTIAALPTDKAIPELARECLAAWLQADVFDTWRAPLHPGDVVIAAKELEVDLAGEWRVDQQFLELFTQDQLRALAGEWSIFQVFSGAGPKRGDKIEAMLASDKGELEGPEILKLNKRLPAPKVLLKAKG